MCRSIFGGCGELAVGVRSAAAGAIFLAARLLGGCFLGGRFLGGRLFRWGLLGGGLLLRRLGRCRFLGGLLGGAFLAGCGPPAVCRFGGGAGAASAGGVRRWRCAAVGAVRARGRACRPVDPAGLPSGCSFAVSLAYTGQVSRQSNPSCQGGWRSGRPSGLVPHRPQMPAADQHHRADGRTARSGRRRAGHPAACAAGPGVPVPGVVSRNDHDPDTTCPSADVTR